MTPKELRETLIEREKQSAEMGLGPLPGITLVMERPNPPAGVKVNTPFGQCEIMNCQQQGRKFQIVFFVKRDKLEKFLKKQGV